MVCTLMLLKRLSGRISRFSGFALRILYSIFKLLGTLRAVLGTALFTIGDTGGVERAAHNVITHTWQIFYTTTAHQHYRVLLQLVAFTGNISRDFDTIGQTHTRNLAQR